MNCPDCGAQLTNRIDPTQRVREYRCDDCQLTVRVEFDHAITGITDNSEVRDVDS